LKKELRQAGRSGLSRGINDKDVISDQLIRRLDSLLHWYQQLLQKYQKLEAENLELKERIARLEKNSSTSSKPPSTIVKTKKRKRGGQSGQVKHTREPFPANRSCIAANLVAEKVLSCNGTSCPIIQNT
jgi:cell division septum initiation protein DivIVA